MRNNVLLRTVCVVVLLRVLGGRLVALSELSRSLVQALYLVLWFRSSVQDRPSWSQTRRLMLALSRHWTQAVSDYIKRQSRTCQYSVTANTATY